MSKTLKEYEYRSSTPHVGFPVGIVLTRHVAEGVAALEMGAIRHDSHGLVLGSQWRATLTRKDLIQLGNDALELASTLPKPQKSVTRLRFVEHVDRQNGCRIFYIDSQGNVRWQNWSMGADSFRATVEKHSGNVSGGYDRGASINDPVYQLTLDGALLNILIDLKANPTETITVDDDGC